MWSRLVRLARRLRFATRRGRVCDDVTQELQTHIELLTARYVQAGMELQEARVAAARQIGNVARVREDVYFITSIEWLDRLGKDLAAMFTDDLRFAWRHLRKARGFSLAAVLTLGLAIGVNAVVFAIVDAVLLRPLPYPEPDRLALVVRVLSRDGVQLSENTGHTGAVFEQIRDQAKTVDAAVSVGLAVRVNLVAGERALAVTQQRVSAGYFAVLGVSPILGREFASDEDRQGGAPVVIFSDRLWRDALHSDPRAIGQTVLLKGEPHTLVGVMPPGFRSNVPADLWAPVKPSRNGEGGGENYTIVARLKDGVSWSQASSEMASVADSALRSRTSPSGATVTHGVISMQKGLVDSVRTPLLLLWASVGIVLLVACVNLAGLLLARGGRRAQELGTRVAIGAGRRVLIRQLLVETALLAAIGGAVGLVGGAVALGMIQRFVVDTLTTWADLRLDARVVAATFALTTSTLVLFGLAPAIQTTRVDVLSSLTQGGSRAVAGSARGWTRRLLVVSEVALGVVLLVAAGLLVRTFIYLQTRSPGFDPTNVVAAAASLEDARYQSHERVAQLFSDSLTRIRVLPGVSAAAVSLGLPYERILNMGAQITGPDGKAEGRFSTLTYVTAGYFETLRLPVLRGRALSDGDGVGAPNVLVVNESFAKRYFPDRDAVGQRIAVANLEREIVGIVGNVQQRGGFNGFGPIDSLPGMYVAFEQFPSGMLRLVHGWFSPEWIVRAASPGVVTEEMLRRAMAETDPQLPLYAIRGVDEVRSEALIVQRVLMSVVGALGLITLLLTAIGIHGLIASGVTERMRELGIRLALGSTVNGAIRDAALPGVYLALAGLAVGGIVAVGTAGVMRRLLWGVREYDPITFAAVAGTLLVVAVVASVVPALRVRRLDPVSLLRSE